MFVENAIFDAVLKGAVLSLLGIFWIIMLFQIVGLRSFSK